jgi:hypothetical protein
MARWGKGLLLASFLLILLGIAFLGNLALAEEEEEDWSVDLRASAGFLGLVSLVWPLLQIAYLLLQRSWELENQLIRMRVLVDFTSDPGLASGMVKILEKESERANQSRARNRPVPGVVRRRRGPRPKSRAPEE